MKKVLFVVLAAAAMVSCAQNDIIELNQEAIDFGGPFIENNTRAADNTNLTAFDVYGAVDGVGTGVVQLFNGAEVTGSVGNAWTCDVRQYWIADAVYTFAAAVDAKSVDVDTTTKMPIALTYETAAQNDLLFAESSTITGKVSGNGKVNFTFNHLLAKAFFTVTSTTADGYTHTVKNIQVGNYTTGTYTPDGTYDAIDKGAWAVADGNKTNIAFADIEDVTAASGPQTNAEVLLIPTTNSFDVTFTVDIYNGGTLLGTEDKTITVNNDILKGNVYNFKIDLTVGELIEFSVSTAPTWGGTTNL